MPKDTVTLALTGENVHLKAFAVAVQNFNSLLEQLTRQIAQGGITWVVQDLNQSSAIATVRGISPRSELIESVIAGYSVIGHALEVGGEIPYQARVKKHARAIAGLLTNGSDIESIRFETPDRDHIIRPKPLADTQAAPLTITLGAVEGNVQTLTNRGSLRFTLYDQLFDKAVSCYLRPGDEERMRGLWGKRVVIEGRIARDPLTGRAVTIRDISQITSRPEGADYRGARGLIPLKPGQELPEITIRRLRDA